MTECTCVQYGTPCDDECNCCDSPYAIEGCDCACKHEKEQRLALLLKDLIDRGVTVQEIREVWGQ